jgi:hypothetical protein
MEQRNLGQTVTQPYHAPVDPHTANRGATIASVLFGVGFLALLVVGIIEAYRVVEFAGVILAYVMIVLCPLIGLTLIIYPLWHKSKLDSIKRKHATLDLAAKEAHTRRENEAHEMSMYVSQTRLYADERGNRPFVFNPRTYEITEVKSGNYLQNVPTHYAPHHEYNYSDTSTGASNKTQISEAQAPTQEYLISQLRYNALQVCLGVSATTGQPFTMDLIEGTHYRIIGGSGFGKSCEAAAILDQVTQTNDPDHLLIGLLDLEHKTSKLFEHLPHIAELQIGRKRVDCIATNPDEVAQQLGYLRQELDRRKVLSEHDLAQERFMLIYVEEFLSLRREVDPDLLEQMMKDFSILALRGRKYGLYLLVAAQVDYASKDLRDAMSQFNVNMSFSVKPSAARAAGFSSNDLLKANFEAKTRGQFVLETTGCNDIFLAPDFDVKAKLRALELSRSRPVQAPFRDRSEPFTERSLQIVNADERPVALRSERSTEVQNLLEKGWGKQAIIEKLWQCKKGGSPKYKEAENEYNQIILEAESESQS